MKHFLPTVFVTVLFAALGCGGGGGSSNTPVPVNGIQGPDTVTEGSEAQYSIERQADAIGSYQWTSTPAALGNFASPNSHSTIFRAKEVDKDTPIEIQVAVAPTSGSPTYLTRKVIIRNIPAGANKAPVAAGIADPSSIEPGGFIKFRDGSADTDDLSPIVKWEWDLTYNPADGFKVDSAEKEPYIQYNDEGIYLIQLRVTDAEGLADTFDQPIQIVVTDGYLGPVAKAAFFPEKVMVCEPVSFQNNGSYPQTGDSIALYEWDWDVDGVYDEEGLFADHSWSEPGVYMVQFRVTDNNGDHGTLGTPLVVAVDNGVPVAEAGASNQNVKIGQTISFDASASADSDCDRGLETYEWDWDNDGTYDDTGELASHFYEYPGNYQVQLRVTDHEGVSDTLDEPIVIYVEAGIAQSWGGDGEDHGFSVAVDSIGNAYVTGRFSGTVDFDPGAETFELTADTSSGAYLSKFDSHAKFLWAVNWGDYDISVGNDVFVSNADFIYVTGSDTLTKFNSSGDVIWSYKTDRVGMGAAFDDSTGIYIAGYHIPEGSTDPEIAILSLDFDGNLNWERIVGGAGDDQAMDITVDGDGDILVSGHFEQSVDFDPGDAENIHVATQDFRDTFLTKYDREGNFMWVQTWESTDAFGVACDNTNAVYVTGFYEGATDFDPGSGTSIRDGEIGSYLSKFSVEGNFMWVAAWTEWVPPPDPPERRDPGWDCYYDQLTGNIFVAGSFETDTDFDPGPGTDVRNGGGAYLTKYATDGRYIDTMTWGAFHETEWDSALALAIDEFGVAYVTGSYVQEVDFGIDEEELHVSNGSYDAYLMRLTPDIY